jgi:hypothetical protein
MFEGGWVNVKHSRVRSQIRIRPGGMTIERLSEETYGEAGGAPRSASSDDTARDLRCVCPAIRRGRPAQVARILIAHVHARPRSAG